MHIADTDLGILGANGIVGAGITLAGGAALSASRRGTGQVVICFLGDGASNRGTFHEGVNLASVWQLPVVYVIENNLYAEKTRISDTYRLPNLSDRAGAFGIPDVSVDGNDVMAVYEAVGEAVSRARRGEGPTHARRGNGLLDPALQTEGRCQTYGIGLFFLGSPHRDAVEAAAGDDLAPSTSLKFAGRRRRTPMEWDPPPPRTPVLSSTR